LPKKYNTPSYLGGTLTSILNTRDDGLFWVKRAAALAIGALGIALGMAG
jgi:hypothetical protein